ncbi:MAG TPA: RsmE family RNA methyltransferase [Opitutaceae bacterium]|nr:RsmE family RNA methyltransferase [Opitutaceae bacterium]
MNLILFESHELAAPLARTDRRAVHVLDVLRRVPGDSFDVGLLNGPRGRATLRTVESATLTLSFTWASPPAARAELALVIGLPRPQTARDILRDATTLGATALHFVRTEKGEASYAQSTLWSSGEWRRQVIAGAEQAFDPRIPTVTHGQTLAEAIAALPRPASAVALDNYESPSPLGDFDLPRQKPVALAFGAERGWSAAERDLLRAQGFAFAHLGPRVLRAETAVIAALSIVRAKLGLM